MPCRFESGYPHKERRLPVKAVFFLYLCSLARNGSSPQGCLPATEQRKLLLVPEGRRVRLPVATERRKPLLVPEGRRVRLPAFFSSYFGSSVSFGVKNSV